MFTLYIIAANAWVNTEDTQGVASRGGGRAVRGGDSLSKITTFWGYPVKTQRATFKRRWGGAGYVRYIPLAFPEDAIFLTDFINQIRSGVLPWRSCAPGLMGAFVIVFEKPFLNLGPRQSFSTRKRNVDFDLHAPNMLRRGRRRGSGRGKL